MKAGRSWEIWTHIWDVRAGSGPQGLFQPFSTHRHFHEYKATWRLPLATSGCLDGLLTLAVYETQAPSLTITTQLPLGPPIRKPF